MTPISADNSSQVQNAGVSAASTPTASPARSNLPYARISKAMGLFVTQISSLGSLLKGLKGIGGLYICADKCNLINLTSTALAQMNNLAYYHGVFKELVGPLGIFQWKELPANLTKLSQDVHSQNALQDTSTTVSKIARDTLICLGSYIWLAEKGVLNQRGVSLSKRASLPLSLIASGFAICSNVMALNRDEHPSLFSVLNKISKIALNAFEFVTGLSARALSAVPELGSTIVEIGGNLHAFVQELGSVWASTAEVKREV